MRDLAMAVVQTRLGKSVVGLALLFALGAGVTYAAIPDANGVIHGCYQDQTGTLRVIDDSSESCRASETALTWNQEGQPGADGATWHTGPGAPGADLGSDGDLYLDTDSGDVYVKSGDWSQTTNITGPEGPQGKQGPPGPEGTSPGFVATGFASPLPDGFDTITSLSLPAGHYIVSASMMVGIGAGENPTFMTCFFRYQGNEGGSALGAEAVADLVSGGPDQRTSLAITDGVTLVEDGSVALVCQAIDQTDPGNEPDASVTNAHLTGIKVRSLTEQ